MLPGASVSAGSPIGDPDAMGSRAMLGYSPGEMFLGLAGAGVEPAPVADLIKMNEGTNMCVNIESDRPILIRASETARLRGVCAMIVYKMIATDATEEVLHSWLHDQS
jgi:hypothetical protein